MLDADIRIARITEQSIYDPVTFKPAVSMRIEFMVGEHGPFVEKIPMADYSAFAREQRLNARAAEIRTAPLT